MVQRKVPNKLGIKPHLLKLDTQLVNLTPSSSSSSSSSHEKLKKIMKKSRSIKRSDESRSMPPFRKKKTTCTSTPTTPQKQSPNYMKSTSSFEARKEHQSPKTPTPKRSKSLKPDDSASAVKSSRTSSLKVVRSLTKTPSFKPVRSSKKVIICKDVDAQKATCSSTLKESKFPDYLQLNPGGTELDGTSAMKVCPYTYCSLNGHHHDPVPPLKCFLSARRRAIKTQKGFKVGCLSPRQLKPNVKKIDVEEPVILDMKEENRDFFVDIYSKDKGSNLECCDIDWEEGDCFDSGNDGLKLQDTDGGGDAEDETAKKRSVERLYDEESVSSGAWSDEDGDSASEGSSQQMKINQDYLNFDDLEVLDVKAGEDENVKYQEDESLEVLLTAESDVNDKKDVRQGLNVSVEDQNMNNKQEETVPNFSERVKDETKGETDNNRTTIIYNIIHFNINVFINGEKTVTVQVPAASVASDKMETKEAMEEEKGMSDEDSEASEVNQVVKDEEIPFNVQDLASTEQLDAVEKEDDPEQEEYKEYDELAMESDVDQTQGTNEMTFEADINTDSICKNGESNDELPDPCSNFRDLSGSKKPGEEAVEDLSEFNLRGPNFLPETPDPDAETVDLRHQNMDERKNAEEWMVDFALQQAVTTLAPARKKKVALLVEAFEKVMPDPVRTYGTHDTHASKAFTNSRPMQACS